MSCETCGKSRPMMEIIPWTQVGEVAYCPQCAPAALERVRQTQAAVQSTLAAIPVLTGTIPSEYEVIDSIFAIDSTTASFLQGVNPNKAFQGVKSQLRQLCHSLGGNAVIHCQYQYRNALADGLIGKNQSLEIFAYGTAVRTK